MSTLPVDSYSATGKPLWLSATSTEFGSPQNVLDDISAPTTSLSTIVTNVANVQKGITQLDDFPLLGTPSVFLTMENNTSTLTPQYSFGFGNATTVIGTTTKLSSYTPLEIVGTNTLRIEEDAIAFRPGTVGNATIDFASNYIGLLGGYVDVQPTGMNVNGATTRSQLNENALIFANSGGQVAEIAQSGNALNIGVPSALVPEVQITPSNVSSRNPIIIGDPALFSPRLTIDGSQITSSSGSSILFAGGVNAGQINMSNRLNVSNINNSLPLNQQISNASGTWNVTCIGGTAICTNDYIVLPSASFLTVEFPVTFSTNTWCAHATCIGGSYIAAGNGANAMLLNGKTPSNGTFAGIDFGYCFTVIGPVNP